MTTRNTHKPSGFSRKLLVLAMLAAFGPAQAEEDESVASLTSPNVGLVSVGGAFVTGNSSERSIFGQYTGWREHDSALLLDLLYVKRDDAGLWTRIEGRNLGQVDPEFGISQEKQGDWKFGVNYGEIVRKDLHTTSTDLGLERKNLRIEMTKWITPHLSVEASFRNEKKEGDRLSGIGGYCSNAISPICAGADTTLGALLFLPEPISSNTRQIEAKLTYFGDKFSVTGGYYGSLFDNSNDVLTPSGVAAALPATATGGLLAANLSQPMALSPDNEAHQFYVSGTYAVLPSTRMTFKYTRTEAIQEQDFGVLGADNLGGKVVTNFGQLGVTSRPLPKLSISGNVRYEDREDQTRLGNYRVDSAGNLYTNTPNSWTKINSKAEASYQFSPVYRGTLGVDYEHINRDRPVSTTLIPSTSMAALRSTTNELGYWAEVRRAMSETINAALSYRHSKRDGYRWIGLDQAAGYPYLSYAASSGLAGTFPITLMNRDRDTLKLSADWMPISDLSLQFWLENGEDSYKGPTAAGAHANDHFSFNVDAAYQLTEDWKLTGYVSTGEQTLRMQQDVGYTANLENLTTSFGLGAVGRIASVYEVGGDLTLMEDRNRYKLGTTTGAAISNLPNVTYRNTTLKLYGKRGIDKVSDIRVDVIQQWATFNEWTWTNFAYTDGTTVGLNPSQDVTYIGFRYSYRFK